jgi:diaminopimelate decarboxylase
VPLARAREFCTHAAGIRGIRLVGVAMHIGSQITELAPFESAASRLIALARELMREGHPLEQIDFGGGLGIPYQTDNAPPPLPADYAAMIKRETKGLNLRLVFAIGRMIAGNAGVLVARVIYVKRGLEKIFVVVDAAMNDLVRPTLYEAYHEIRPVRAPSSATQWILADVVGPVCESGDYLALDRTLPAVAAGDLVAIMTAGAYGAVQSGTYNTRALVPEVLVRGAEFAVVRPRVDAAAVIALDRLPPWLRR